MALTTKQRAVSAGITVVLIVLLHIFLWFSQLPMKDITELYDKLDDTVWTKFLPKKIKMKEPEPEEVKPKEIEEPEEVKKITEVTKPQVQKKQFDAQKLRERLKRTRIQRPVQRPRDPTQQESTTSPTLRATDRSQINRSKFSLLDGGAKSLPSLPRTAGKPSSTKIQAGKGESVTINNAKFEGSSSLRNISEGPSGISDIALNKFEPDKLLVSDVFRALIEWMKRNPEKFGPLAKQFMGYRDGGLTSIVKFRIGGRHFDLFLLCFESNLEVRIALIENNEVTFLIDKGFTRESQKIQAGTVDRSGGEIASLEMRPLPLGHAKDQEFWDVFMSWWENARREVEN